MNLLCYATGLNLFMRHVMQLIVKKNGECLPTTKPDAFSLAFLALQWLQGYGRLVA